MESLGEPVGSVFPSENPSVWMSGPIDEYGGAHEYTLRNSLGFNDGQAQYADSTQTIKFVKKLHDGTMEAGAQSEQLALIMLDRAKKLNSVYPSPQNEAMVFHLNGFLNACKERVEERMSRGVMGQLQK